MRECKLSNTKLGSTSHFILCLCSICPNPSICPYFTGPRKPLLVISENATRLIRMVEWWCFPVKKLKRKKALWSLNIQSCSEMYRQVSLLLSDRNIQHNAMCIVPLLHSQYISTFFSSQHHAFSYVMRIHWAKFICGQEQSESYGSRLLQISVKSRHWIYWVSLVP